MTGLEPVTPALSAQCSNHLSYTPLDLDILEEDLTRILFSLERR